MRSGVVARPGLLGRLAGPARVTVVSAPPGSGKTVLLRSWIDEAQLTGRVAEVLIGRGDRHPQQFWISVLAALRGTGPGSVLVQPLTATPDLDGWAVVERLLTDLATLDEPVWLVIDDVHELDADALRQLELLMLRAPSALRFVLATRHDLRLGLHRLRLDGELAEIRSADLRFTLAEAGELFAAAGVELPAPTLVTLHDRTEGWAAGLRLAALLLGAHPDPLRFAVEFSGTERTVAEYLLAEVLDQQNGEVRQLLLRTSILERVNGELASLLTGDNGGERILQDLEQANAFVVSLDPARSWFRYHHMFADLLQMELRRTAPGEVAGLHRSASGWLAAHGFTVEAIRHAQAAHDWNLAAGLLVRHWPSLYLDGQASVIHELLAGFPAPVRAADADLAVLAAADELACGSVEAAERYLDLAEREPASESTGQREYAQLLLGVVRLLLAHQRGDRSAVTDQAERLPAITAATAEVSVLGEDLHALELVSLGMTEIWNGRFADAERHLDGGVALARRIRRPFLEFTGVAYQTAVEVYRSFPAAAERGLQAIELARRHGWTDEAAAGQAYGILGFILALQGRPEEAESWIQSAERVFRADAQPGSGLAIYYFRGVLDLALGRDGDALAAFQAAEQQARRLAVPHHLLPRTRALLMVALVRRGELSRAEKFLAELGEQDRQHGEVRIGEAALRLAQHDPQAAAAVLAPVVDGSAAVAARSRLTQAFLLEAIARDALGDEDAAGVAVERALDLAEPDGVLLWFLVHPAPDLLERNARHRTTHAALVTQIQSLLAGRGSAAPTGPRPLPEPLSDSETRVLRYLPTNMTAPEIAVELSVSRNTVKTHVRNLYAKLGVHQRGGAVARARELGLLAPSALRR
ncbi:MAG TPA: LuxR C-terminal-related transcriptional regulator [Streptosporangiaceae bacterium]|nr:LuxR C-terminal-related transcriptional regulator [Streptosporangiaceae bacterium]